MKQDEPPQRGNDDLRDTLADIRREGLNRILARVVPPAEAPQPKPNEPAE